MILYFPCTTGTGATLQPPSFSTANVRREAKTKVFLALPVYVSAWNQFIIKVNGLQGCFQDCECDNSKASLGWTMEYITRWCAVWGDLIKSLAIYSFPSFFFMSMYLPATFLHCFCVHGVMRLGKFNRLAVMDVLAMSSECRLVRHRDAYFTNNFAFAALEVLKSAAYNIMKWFVWPQN